MFNNPENQEMLKPMYFGMNCFSDTGFDLAIEKLIELANKNHPIKVVYTQAMQNNLDVYIRRISENAQNVNIDFEMVSDEAYNKLENRYLAK
jgi:hypothetical protein